MFLDKCEERLSQLGVDTTDIKERDAYMRLVAIADRMETRISNLMVEVEEMKKTWERNMATIAKLKKELDEINEEYPEV